MFLWYRFLTWDMCQFWLIQLSRVLEVLLLHDITKIIYVLLYKMHVYICVCIYIYIYIYIILVRFASLKNSSLVMKCIPIVFNYSNMLVQIITYLNSLGKLITHNIQCNCNFLFLVKVRSGISFLNCFINILCLMWQSKYPLETADTLGKSWFFPCVS